MTLFSPPLFNKLCFSIPKVIADFPLLAIVIKVGSKMTLNYQVDVERYPFPNEVVGGSISVMKYSLYLTKKAR